MAQIINTNIASLNAQRNLNKSQSANQTALQRLSSGLRINSAKDDAAGLAISTRFVSQIRGLNVAVRNAGDGIALAQTAEGALGSITDNLQRIRELAIQSANATNSDVDREALQAEVSQLVDEISRTAEETDFNGRKLLDGNFAASFQIGANAGQTVDFSIAELTADRLGASQSAGVSALGNSSALGNGDLIINNIAIGPSKAEDDTASTNGNDASSIAKVAAINRYSEETGVTAATVANVAAGSEQTGSADSGTLVLNGVNIAISTSTDTDGSRASVVASINAVSDQTGVTAVDTGSDANGVQLVAADGRNIQTSFSGFTGSDATVAAATGLAAPDTYYGGYTLIADGDVENVVITGGDNTGNGNLANSGLSYGSYSRGEAQLTTTTVTSTDGVSVGNLISLEGQAVEYDSSDGPLNNDLFNSTSGEILTITTSDGQTAVITASTAASVTADVTLTATSGFGADSVATALNGLDGVEASAETKIQLSTLALTTSGTFAIYDTNTSGQELVSYAFVSSATISDFADAINAATTGTLVAQLDTAGTSLIVTDVTGNTLSVNINSGTTVGSNAINLASFSSPTSSVGATTLSLRGDSSTADIGVAVGYIKDFDVTDDDITSVSVTSNLSGTTTSALSTGLASAFLSTAGAISSAVASTNSITQTVTPALTGLDDGDILVNGVTIGAADSADDTASSIQASDGTRIQTSLKEASGIAVAAAINEVASETGVSAEVNETVVVGGDGSATSDYAAGDSGRIFINGVEVGTVTLINDGSGGVDTDASRQAAITLINQKSGQTGVTAEDNGVSITLRAADGRNISVAIDNDDANNTGFGTGFGAQVGLDAGIDGIGEADIVVSTTSASVGVRGTQSEAATYETTYSTVTLSAAAEIEIGAGTKGFDEVENLGLQLGTFGGGTDGQFLTDIDISTSDGAQLAINAVDNALELVASQRADLGATQNRLESTVNNLQITSENLAAANSRIQDADFAAESAELSRTQVLQQAGISILAQANQLPQQVLSLLQ